MPEFNKVWVIGGLGHWGSNIVKSLESMNVNVQVIDESMIGYDASAVLRIPNTDPVIIATPEHTHWPLINVLMQRGCSMLVEKPVVLETHQHGKINEHFGSVTDSQFIMPSHVYRFNPGYDIVLDMIRRMPDNTSTPQAMSFMKHGCNNQTNLTDMNMIHRVGIHDVYTLLYLEQDMVLTRKNQWGMPNEDEDSLSERFSEQIPTSIPRTIYRSTTNTEVLVRYETYDSTLEFDWNWKSVTTRREVEIAFEVGNTSVIRWDDVAKTVTRYDLAGEYRRERYQIVEQISYVDEPSPLDIQLSHFLDCFVRETKPIASMEIEQSALRILNELEYRTSRSF